MGKPINRLNAVVYATLIEEMVDGSATRAELGEASGMSHHTILSVVRALHERGLIHITSWEKDALGRFTVAAFTFGRGKDAKKPARRSIVEVKRASRLRKVAAGTLVAGLGAR